jgi:site-specific DNA-methyltransferase (adenine-specific)
VAAHTRIATPPTISHEPVITITSHPDRCADPATIRSAPKLSMLSAEMTSQNTGAAMTTSMRPYYADDLVTLWLGDCREVTAWLDADVLVTDPPYGRFTEIGGKGTSRPRGIRIMGDKDTEVRDYVLGAWERQAVVFGDLLLPPPEGTRQVLIYRKCSVAGAHGTFGGFRRDTEAVYLVGPWQYSGIGGRTSVLATGSRNIPATRYGHPHAKPVDVMETLIAACAPGTIADPFAGSGSTLVAARNLGRKAIGVELDERYAEMAARRLAQGVLTFG